MADCMYYARADEEPTESEATDEAREFFAHLTPEALKRMVSFLDAVDQYLIEHPPTGTVESLIQGTLESINDLPVGERQRIQTFLDLLSDRFGSPSELNS